MDITLPARRRWKAIRVVAIVASIGLALSACSMRVPADPVAVSQAPAATETTTGQAVATPADPGTAGSVAPGAVVGSTAPGTGADTAGAAQSAAPGAATANTGPAASDGTAGKPASTGDDIVVSGPNSQGVTDTSVKIGVLAPISGAAGFLGQNELDGVNAYFSSINAKGGIKGRTFKTVVVDTAFDPAADVTGARQLVERDKVFAMIGVLGDASAPYVTSKGIPNVVLGATPPAFSSKYPTTYPVALNTVQSVVAMAQYLMEIKKAPIKSVAILYDTQNLNVKPWLQFMEKAWTVHGVKVASVDAFNLSDASCDQLVTKMRNLKIDFWQAGQSLGWPICLAAASRQGYSPPYGIGGPYSADTKFVGGAGKGSDGVYAQMTGVQIRNNTGQPYPAAKNNVAPEVNNFINSMKTFSPNSADVGSLENIWTQSAWAMAKLLVEAVSKQAQAVTWKGVNQYIQGLDNWQSGLVQPVDFRPNCKTGSETWIFQWKRQPDGSLVESDWRPYGGVVKVPDAIKNALIPGAGKCYLSRMADAGLP